MTVACLLLLLALAVLVTIPNARADPPQGSPPPAPKTRAQIASEAYAIESHALAASGSKSVVSCVGISLSCPAGAAINTSNLAMSYDMETLNAGNLKDFSGNSRDCTPHNGVTAGGVGGEYGAATQFDGADDYFTCTLPTTPASATWHTHLNIVGNTQIFFTLAAGGGEYLYARNPGGSASCADGGFSNTAAVSTGWHTIDCVFRGAPTSELVLYIDGVSQGAVQWNQGFSAAWATLYIGSYNQPPGSLPFAGIGDEVSIWTRGLTGAEIGALASAGAPACAGAPPTNKGAATFTTSTTWDTVKYRFTAAQRIELSITHPSISFQILNSCIDGGNLGNAFLVNDTTTSEIYEWDGTTAVFLTVRNSTLRNFSAFITHDNSGGNYRVGAVVMTLDNVTITNFDTYTDRTHSVERSFFNPIHDVTLSAYNRADNSFCAFDQHALSTTRGYEMRRVRVTESNSIATGCVAGNDLRVAKDNYFQGGFLQITFGADFEHGVSPNFGSPTEFVNWSGNYANDSRHTVFGFYGTGTGSFGDHLGTNAYATIYGNYVNNSRYIPYQSSGNVSGLRLIGNYIRGPIPWPGGLPSFELAILLGGENHDSLIDHNYLWDMDDAHISGITIGFAAHDNVVSNNVIYDVGSNHIRLEGQILKYKNPTDCSGPAGCSDYSWKGSNNLVVGNYLAGGTGSLAISVDSGKTVFIGNTIVSAGTGTFLIREGLPCSPACGFAWVDWVNGWPDTPTISWSGTIPPEDEGRFWLRSERTGGLNIVAAGLSVDLTTNLPAHYGTLQTPRCVIAGAATGGRTTTDAEVLAYTGQTCGPVTDPSHFAGPGNFAAREPERWYNKTLTLSFAVRGSASGNANAQVDEPSSFTGGFLLDNGTWAIQPGHDYRVFLREGLANSNFAADAWGWFGIFVLIMVLAGVVYFAYRFRRWRNDE